MLLTPFLLYVRRWHDLDTARAVAALDRTLHLDERATTAWELLRRNETRAVALLVLREAGERLKDVDARKLFPRSWGWRAYTLVPLAALWLGSTFRGAVSSRAPDRASLPRLPAKLRELARRLQEKAQSAGLPQTLEAGRELEKIAQQGMEAEDQRRSVQERAGRLAGKMAAERKAARQAPFGTAESSRQLADLRAELEAARESFDAADSEGEAWQERLAGLEPVEKAAGPARERKRVEPRRLKAFLDKLERGVAGSSTGARSSTRRSP